MDGKKLLLAMNEIDDKYIRQADIFGPVCAAKPSPALRVLHWAGAAAACLCTAAILLLVLYTNGPAPSQDVLSTANQDVQTGSLSSEGIGSTALIPLSELPGLDFPTREESDGTVNEAIGCGPQEESRSLSQEEIASIWGQEHIVWEGLDLEEGFDVTGEAWYIERKFQGVRLYISPENPQGEIGECMQVEISPGNIPSTGMHFSGSVEKRSSVWGTDVSVTAAYPGEGARFSVSFLTGPAGGEDTLGIVAECTAYPPSFSEGIAKELLTRLTSQSLRPGNVFQLSQLETAEGGTEPVPSAPKAEDAEALLESMVQDLRDEIETAARKMAEVYVRSWETNLNNPCEEASCENLRVIEVAEDGNSFVLSLRLILKTSRPENELYFKNLKGATDTLYFKEDSGPDGVSFIIDQTITIERSAAESGDLAWNSVSRGPSIENGIQVDWPIE